MKLECYGVLLAVTFGLYKEITRRDELIKELADFQLSIKGFARLEKPFASGPKSRK